MELIDPDGDAISDPVSSAAELHRLEATATERLARFSKMALDAGVAERRVRIVERQAQNLAHAFTTALDQHPIAAEMTVSQRAERRPYKSRLSGWRRSADVTPAPR